VEVGAGRGAFAMRLGALGFHPLLLDCDVVGLHRVREEVTRQGTRGAKIAAEARRLPFADGTLGAIVLADTLRQISRPRWAETARELRRALADGAYLLLLEDEPEGRGRSEENYRLALRLLARVDPTRHHPVLAADEVRRELQPVFSRPWAEGRQENTLEVEDPFVPLRWMRQELGRRGEAEPPELPRLEERVRRHGMRYGRYWYQIYRRPEGSG